MVCSLLWHQTLLGNGCRNFDRECGKFELSSISHFASHVVITIVTVFELEKYFEVSALRRSLY
jgi:hypothetical protein